MREAEKFRDRKRLALALALALPLLRVNRAAAQDENELGYRHEFYREDNHRINVDTDSARFNLKLSSQAALSGEVVFDAISGATPTGARLAYDAAGQQVVLFPEQWSCDFFAERNPKIKLSALPPQKQDGEPVAGFKQ